MPETGFHFAQPAWFWGLLALPPVAWWLWRTAARPPRGRCTAMPIRICCRTSGSRALKTLGALGALPRLGRLWLLLLTAMAGPRWNYEDVRLFQPGDNLLILLDVSRSMETADVAPSRIAAPARRSRT
jgi:Ca-activated chloride channel family protein